MEYLGIKLEESEAWIITAFNSMLSVLKDIEKGVSINEKQKTLLFSVFYSGVLYGNGIKEV